MIRLFKDLRIKYYITELLGIIILLGLNFYIYGKTGNKLIYSFLIFITLVFIVLNAYRYTKKATLRIIELSNNANKNTSIKDTISSFEKMLERAKNNKIKTLLVINLTGLYINIGETKKAMTLYKNFQPTFERTVNGDINQIIYLNNICEICIREKLIPLAKENLSILKRLIKNNKFDPETKRFVNKIYGDLVVELVFKENKIKDYKSIELYYLKRFGEEDSIPSKVFFANQLSKVYKKLKNKKEEEKFKKYYKDNRGELKYK